MSRKTPERFVNELRVQLDRLILNKGQHAFTRKKVSTIVGACGWKAKSRQRMAALQASLEEAGVYPYPFLTEPKLKTDSWIRFSRQAGSHVPVSSFFAKEDGLQDFIRRYHVQIFEAVPELAELELVQREYPLMIEGKELSADFVFRESEERWVVVELKLEDPSLGAPNQLCQYMDALRLEGHGVRGILMTSRPDSESIEKITRKDIRAQQREYPIEWYWYSVDVSLEST